MTEQKKKTQTDAGHFSFLELIQVITQLAGPSFAKGALIKTGISAAKKHEEMEYATLEEFVASIDGLDNPIAQFEGPSKHYGDGVFGLPACPFAGSISTYMRVTKQLPQDYKDVTAELNKPSAISERLRVGQGAAVSPFCGVHQPIRSALGDRIKVGGKKLVVYQLGCKSGSGAKGLADALIEQVNVKREMVEKILDENMCCYCVRLED